MGAQGGTDSHQGSGGKGGYTAGEVYLEVGEELFVTVGGFGDANAQGFNGGGKAWTNVSGGSYGGGATDIRVGGTGHFNRILVAGGGGSSVRNYTGGYAGGVIGMDGTGSSGQLGTGASQSASGGGGISGSFGPGASEEVVVVVLSNMEPEPVVVDGMVAVVLPTIATQQEPEAVDQAMS
ncbi:glycine rich domain-containing protein [Erysipelothrix sp. D19-032]